MCSAVAADGRQLNFKADIFPMQSLNLPPFCGFLREECIALAVGFPRGL
jgi:hypothetical protein